MGKIDEAKELLKRIGMPKKQQSDICALTLLAMANVPPNATWSSATNKWVRIHDILQFCREKYDCPYAENSRETFRKQAIHHFRNAALIEDNGKATNSPHYRYRLTNESLSLVQSYLDISWPETLRSFMEDHESLISRYESKKQMQKMPVKINSIDYTFSPGEHNELQKAILEEFAPRFAPNSECLYVGDTLEKDLYKDVEALNSLGFEITLHDKMPDVVLYREDKNWLYFIEAFHSVGPMDSKRILEITEMTRNVTAGKIFVTAFADFKSFKKNVSDIAWETEIWIAEEPEHMIHLNGDMFFGPR